MKFVFVVITSEVCGACKQLKAKVNNQLSAYDRIVSWVKPYVHEVKDVVFPELRITQEYSFLAPAVQSFPTFMVFDLDAWNSKKLIHYSKFQSATKDKETFEKWIKDVESRIKQAAFNTNHNANSAVSKQAFMDEEKTVSKPNIPAKLPTTASMKKSVIHLLE